MSNTKISFKVSKEEHVWIAEIVERADCADPVGLAMDITACHANGRPLKLNELLHAGDASFYHDIRGIQRHLNRSTGKLENCFLPRYAVKQKT